MYQTLRDIKERIASYNTSKMICIFENFENPLDIKLLTTDFYLHFLKLGIIKVAIVIDKKLKNNDDQYKLRTSLKSWFDPEKIDLDLFFEIDYARMWIRNDMLI